MRTTIDLPDDLHSLVTGVARSRRQTLSQIVTELVRTSLEQHPPAPDVQISPRTGLPVIRLGRVTTVDDVRSLDDNE